MESNLNFLMSHYQNALEDNAARDEQINWLMADSDAFQNSVKERREDDWRVIGDRLITATGLAQSAHTEIDNMKYMKKNIMDDIERLKTKIGVVSVLAWVVVTMMTLYICAGG